MPYITSKDSTSREGIIVKIEIKQFDSYQMEFVFTDTVSSQQMPVEYGIASIIIVALMELVMMAVSNLDTAKDKSDERILIL